MAKRSKKRAPTSSFDARPMAEQLLEKVSTDIAGSAKQKHGTPKQGMKRGSDLVDAYLRNRPEGRAARITPIDMSAIMMLHHIGSIGHNPTNLRAFASIAGLAACGAEVAE